MQFTINYLTYSKFETIFKWICTFRTRTHNNEVVCIFGNVLIFSLHVSLCLCSVSVRTDRTTSDPQTKHNAMSSWSDTHTHTAMQTSFIPVTGSWGCLQFTSAPSKCPIGNLLAVGRRSGALWSVMHLCEHNTLTHTLWLLQLLSPFYHVNEQCAREKAIHSKLYSQSSRLLDTWQCGKRFLS